MSTYYYDRDSVPVTGIIYLEAQFTDSAGNTKDPDDTPTIEITDASTTEVISATQSGVNRLGVGRYKYRFTVPDGYTQGMWNDTWEATLDGYAISATFDFFTNSQGKIEAVGTVVEPLREIGDAPEYDFSQDEIKGINFLLKTLEARILNIRYDESGNLCPVFGTDDLVSYLCASLAEFNSTPAFTAYSFDNPLVYSTWSNIITQGAYLIGMSAKAVHESGKEFTLNDNGVTVNPPPVSSTIMSVYNAQLSTYQANLKEIKRNHRAAPMAISAGSILNGQNLRTRNLRHRKEKVII